MRFTIVNFVYLFYTIVNGFYPSKLLSVTSTNVKPEGEGGGGSGNPREFDCDLYPQCGYFDHLIFQLQRAEEK